MTDACFPQSLRLKSSMQFTVVIEQGQHSCDSTLVINAIPNELGFSRIGVTIPKRTGNSPVRNHWKRLVREAFRTQKDAIPAGFDFVVRPRRGARPSQGSVSLSLRNLARKVCQSKKHSKSRSRKPLPPGDIRRHP